MKSFLATIIDSTVTWTSDDDRSISSNFSSDIDDDDDDSILSREGGVENDVAAVGQEEPWGGHPPENVVVDDAGPDGIVPNHHELQAQDLQDQQQQQEEEQNPPQEGAPRLAAPEGENHDRENNVVEEQQQEEQEQQRQQNQQQQQQQPVQPVQPAQRPTGRDAERSVLQNLTVHRRSNELLFRIARSEELPLIRAEIDWNLLGSQLSTYPGAEIGDSSAAFLLQSILRMDPPLQIIRDLIRIFPSSCVDMDPFYAACQYASDDAVQLLMHQTMNVRDSEGIPWSMLALLGDARIRVRHARFLLRHTPQVMTENSHGVFGVSPLDRMLSGAFIHGNKQEWTSKLKLALLTADRGFLDENGKPFYPFHALVRRLVSSDFQGTTFGPLSFVNCLSACIDGEGGNSPFNQKDEDGNLPIHVVLGSPCDTTLATIGERKLVKFLLQANRKSVIIPNGDGVLPMRLAIQNGWPVYDTILDACPAEYTHAKGVGNILGDAIKADASIDVKRKENLVIHDVLGGQVHPRFGVSGARAIIKFILDKYPYMAGIPDANGSYPIHLAIANGWPCHDMIVGKAPFTLAMKDRNDMYPYQICALTESHSKGMRLSVLFEIIREGPLLLLEDRGNINGREGIKRKVEEVFEKDGNENPCKKKSIDARVK
jgi:hypothetical protein